MKIFKWLEKNFLEGLSTVSVLLPLLLLFRIIETYFLNQNQYIENLGALFFHGLFNDFVFSIAILIVLCFLPIIKYKLLKNIVHSIIGLMLSISLISSFYFTISLQLLDRTIYQFTFEQLKTIIQTFGSFEWYYLLIALPIPLMLVLYKVIPLKYKNFIFLIFGLIPLVFILIAPKPKWDFEKLAVKNKVAFFINDSYKYFTNASESSFVVDADNPSKEFALLRNRSTKNPLGAYFELKDNPPNLVFLIIESLSSSYSGPKADEISFTPYIDSLAKSSIYFNNFISTAERTFGVLPSTLASLPHGDKGFSVMRSNMPNHQSLPQILLKNNYNAAFYYGGDANFDYMRTFMEVNGITEILDHAKKFDINKKKKEDEGKPFGVNDSIFFKEVAKKWKGKLQQPFMHIYLSLSMHYPFEIENQEHYIKLAKNIIDNSEKKVQKEKYYKQLKVFSTAVYTDQAVRDLINNYKKHKEFENTIFLIYGDHSFGPVPKKNAIEKYRTPLYIYSPLLKSAFHSSVINTHLDLTPTILNLLDAKYNLEAPSKTHWLGEPFAIKKGQNFSRELILMLNSREVEDFLSGKYFLAKKRVYEIDKSLDLKLIDNQSLYDSIARRRDSLIYIQKLALDKNQLVIDERPRIILENIVLNGRKFTQQNEYVMLLVHELNNKEEAIQMDINLELNQNLDNKAMDKPLLIMAFKDKKDSLLYWKEIDYSLPQDSVNTPIDYKMYFKTNSNLPLEEGLTIKVYFWNQKKSDANFELTNSYIQLKGIRE